MEPVYTYVKGQGWQVRVGEVHTARIGKYVVTVEQRRPNMGELFWYGSAEQNLKFVERDRYWVGVFNNTLQETMRNFTPYDGRSLVGDGDYSVITLDRVEE